MLQRLSQVDWSGLHFPTMPELLRGLASDDEDIRTEAYNNIYDAHLVGASIQHPVIPYIIPFLIELLTYDEVNEKSGILLLLMQIAADIYIGVRNYEDSQVYRQAYVKLLQGVPIFKRFEKHSDENIRQDVSSLLKYIEQTSI